MRTDVSITVDTEFNIAGAFDDPARYAPISTQAVDCIVNGQGHGLAFLLDTFTRYGIAATFFVEALNFRYFGDAPMGEIVSRILKAGQDVQLHIHPVWLSFEHGRLTERKPNDDCDGRGVEDLCKIFQMGLDAFQRWGAPRPMSVRTGGLRVDRAVYKALHTLGIPCASNVGMGIFKPRDPALCLHGGRHLIEGVMELPILSYRDIGFAQHCRTLQITSCSWSEIEHVLLSAHAAGVANVVILTHPFEYVKLGDFRFQQMSPNRLIQRRLERLCDFLARNGGRFRPVSFKAGMANWLRSGEAKDPLMSSPVGFTLGRMIENRVNDLWRFN